MIKILSSVIISFALIGCATKPQAPISYDAKLIDSNKSSIGVVINEIPKPNSSFPGADCLLCIATASLYHKTLNSHIDTLKSDDLKNIKDDLVSLLTSRGLKAVSISESVDAKKLPDVAAVQENGPKADFTKIGAKYGVDRIIYININFVGIERKYASYIPVGLPMATARGEVYMVNLKSQKYEWYRPLESTRTPVATWDEPPNYSALTGDFYEAMKSLKNDVLQPFHAN